MTTVKTGTLAFYAQWLENWVVNNSGPKPTAAMIDTFAALGAEHGKQCLVGAMSLRPGGVIRREFLNTVGNPQLNKMGGFVKTGLLERHLVADRQGQKVYYHTLTPKGKALVDKVLKPVTAKPKATKKPKVKKPVAKPVEAPEASPVTPEQVS